MEQIKSSAPYPCTGCEKNGTDGCRDKDCRKWRDWFFGGAWRYVVALVKAAAERMKT